MRSRFVMLALLAGCGGSPRPVDVPVSSSSASSAPAAASSLPAPPEAKIAYAERDPVTVYWAARDKWVDGRVIKVGADGTYTVHPLPATGAIGGLVVNVDATKLKTRKPLDPLFHVGDPVMLGRRRMIVRKVIEPEVYEISQEDPPVKPANWITPPNFTVIRSDLTPP